MRSASSDRSGPGRLARPGLLALGALVLALASGAAGSRAGNPVELTPVAAHRIPDGTLEPAGQLRLRRAVWQGGTYTASTGELVRVHVSESYPEAGALGQRWADFLAALPHGSELGLATTYVVTPVEIRSFCGPYALGCYRGNELVFMGETVSGVTPEEVARHEYGHHVAANRPNPPWLAVAWGPKRWASTANVCLRAQRGEVFPGDEGERYELNPGEGFAEVYRVLAERKAGAPSFTWSLVDASFAPDAAALQAAEQDVLQPWSTPVTQTYRGRFTNHARPIWKVAVSTPLDGGVSVTLTLPRGSAYELTMLAAGGRVVAKGLWSGLAQQRITSTVCGERSLVLRVTRRGPAGRFTVRVTHD